MNLAGQFPQYPSLVDRTAGNEAPLLQAQDFLARQWRLIILTTILSVIVGATYLAMTPSKYTASADMIIDTKRVTWTQSELATENRMVEDASVESEIETTKSEKVALSVIRRLHLNEDPEFISTSTSLKQLLLKVVKLAPAIEPEPNEDQLTRRSLWAVKDGLRVTRLGRSYIEQIAFTS